MGPFTDGAGAPAASAALVVLSIVLAAFLLLGALF